MTSRRERFFETVRGARERRGVALMGVCNVTPDSFSDGDRFFEADAARARVDALIAEGADVVDVGGESTRPGAAPVSAKEQLARVLGVVEHAAARGACVSVDTADAEVAAVCLDAGACAVNDVSCLRDEGLASTCAAHDAAFVLMHSREPMSEMKGFGAYPDDAYGEVVHEAVLAEWWRAAERAMARGVKRASLVMDPGLGFAKNARHSTWLLARTGELARALGDVPLCVGASRKSFLTSIDRGAPPSERVGASVAAALFAARSGAGLVRVHDVRATRQAIDLERALAEARQTQNQKRRE